MTITFHLLLPLVQIANYKILQRIGHGGMGEVYMAEQLEPVRRRAALKVIRTEAPAKEVLARFEAERQALVMMDHQNIHPFRRPRSDHK